MKNFLDTVDKLLGEIARFVGLLVIGSITGVALSVLLGFTVVKFTKRNIRCTISKSVEVGDRLK